MRKTVSLLILLLLFLNGFTQEIQRFNPDTIRTIQLDSTVNIRAQKFGVETFINGNYYG